MDCQHEREARERAGANLVAGAARIQYQERIIEELVSDGHEVDLVLQLLRALHATRSGPRVLIIRELEDLQQADDDGLSQRRYVLR